ncbi:unnamed protein product [Rotaria sp. Silwood1]|nr:unnamed protein product [Rotaria sp. Silwood1]
MVLEQPESPIRSCTLAMLIEPIELYVRDFHDLLILKLNDKSNSDISRKLVQIVLPLDNDDTQKFKETYKNLFENSIETDIEVVQGEKTIMSKLLIQLLEGQRNEEPNHSLSATKLIAKKLSEAVEGGKPVIDYDIFIKIFTHDAFAQLSSIFDMYEDQYGCPIQVAIEHQCQSKIEAECFQDIVEYTRSPSGYHAKILRQALDKEPIDYTTLIRTIIETYKNLFENSIETDIEVVQGEKTIISKLLIQLLEGQRNEEPNHSLSATKLIAKKLSEGVEGGKPVIDYDIFIKIFTHDAFAQLSSIFDMYEDQYGYPIQVAIEHQCQSKIEAECFQDIVEYTRSPSGYHAKILRQALDKEPIDYTTLIRTIIGHESKDLCEVKLEYSKMYDETLHQTIEHRIDIAEIKKIFVVIIATGDDLTPRNGEEDCSGDKDSSSSTGAPLNAITSKVMEKKSKHSLDVLEKFAQILKIRTSN